MKGSLIERSQEHDMLLMAVRVRGVGEGHPRVPGTSAPPLPTTDTPGSGFSPLSSACYSSTLQRPEPPDLLRDSSLSLGGMFY